MDFLALAKSRYTTKKYDSTAKISDADIEALKEIIRLSPSSINSQPWKFYFISDTELKNTLAEASLFNKPKVEAASHLVVFCAIDDVKLFEEKIQKNLPEGSVAYYDKLLKPLPEAEIKAWFGHQVYLSLGFFLSACAAMGIDSTPMEGIENDKYAEILKIEGYKPLFAVAIGYRNAEDANQPSVKPKYRFVAEDVVESI
ncbi:MAG: NAD(P)H-dependent oxidoreductase [Spirosomataceae bacterium]